MALEYEYDPRNKITEKNNYHNYQTASLEENLAPRQLLSSKQVDLLLLLKEKSDRLLGLTDSQFSEGLFQLTQLLFEIDPPASKLMKAIDEKAQDLGTYYFAAYSESRDVYLSLRVFRIVRSLIRYIVLMDRYYEVENHEYKTQAENILNSVTTECEGYMKYTTPFSLAQCWPFWEFEELLKNRMLNGISFQKKEIMHHLMFKSSDAPTIYARVIDSELDTFNTNAALVLHYNQALQDIQDDFEDIEEDLLEKMPNTFILAATEHTSFEELAKQPNRIREAIIESGALHKIMCIVLDCKLAAQNINLPPNYEFLKYLTKTYADTVIRNLTKPLEQICKDDNNREECCPQIP